MQSKKIEIIHERYKARTADQRHWTYFTKKGKIEIYGGTHVGDVNSLIETLEKKYNKDDEFNKTLTTHTAFDILKNKQLKFQNEFNKIQSQRI